MDTLTDITNTLRPDSPDSAYSDEGEEYGTTSARPEELQDADISDVILRSPSRAGFYFASEEDEEEEEEQETASEADIAAQVRSRWTRSLFQRVGQPSQAIYEDLEYCFDTVVKEVSENEEGMWHCRLTPELIN